MASAEYASGGQIDNKASGAVLTVCLWVEFGAAVGAEAHG